MLRQRGREKTFAASHEYLSKVHVGKLVFQAGNYDNIAILSQSKYDMGWICGLLKPSRCRADWRMLRSVG